VTSDASPAGYQPGDRVILIATDPYIRLTPGTRGTVTGRHDRQAQIRLVWDDGSTPVHAARRRRPDPPHPARRDPARKRLTIHPDPKTERESVRPGADLPNPENSCASAVTGAPL
jgi:hypothetical protein